MMNDNNNKPDEPCKRKGHLQLKIEKLSEFAREQNGRRRSEPVQVLGYKWRVYAKVEDDDHPVDSDHVQKCLGFYLQCGGNNDEEVSTLSCSATATMKVLAQKQGKQDYVRKLDSREYHVNGNAWGFQYMAFEELMNSETDCENGWYDKVNDCIMLTADFEAIQPNGVNGFIARKHILLVDGEKVKVNKHQLAARSDHFECFSFGEGYKESSNIELELPGNVGHFKRMLDTMHPDNHPLDDQCIEGVFHLANQFLLGEVEIKCRKFLAKESKRSAIFKRAEKYGFDTLKKQILDLPKEEFSKDADFFENINEFAKLDGKAREALNERIGQLFGNKDVAK